MSFLDAPLIYIIFQWLHYIFCLKMIAVLIMYNCESFKSNQGWDKQGYFGSIFQNKNGF